MICRIRIQTGTIVSHYKCTTRRIGSAVNLSLDVFEIKNDRNKKYLNESDGFYQWSDASDSVDG